MPEVRSPDRSPDRALSILRRIQTHRVVLAGQAPITGLTTIGAEEAEILKALGVAKPTAATPYVNL